MLSLRYRPTILFYVISSFLLTSIKSSDSGSLFNEFVLETDTDSSPVASSLVSQNPNYGQASASYTQLQPASGQQTASLYGQKEESNTRIVTDEYQQGSSNSGQKHQLNGNKLREDTELHGSRAITNNNNNKPSASQTRVSISNQQSTLKPRLTTNSYGSDQSGPSIPKEEKRLLIQITSNDNDDDRPDTYQKPSGSTPQRNPQSSSLNVGSSSEEGESTHSLGQHPKRKPSITISIQDANLNKQTSGSAVIVRPDENGNIVIATVNTAASQHQSSGHHKPIVSPSSGSQSNQHQGGAGSHDQPPYREPVNNPMQSIINQHISTTRRPTYDQYGGSGSSSGTSSSNIRPPLNPILVNPSDERPHRPTSTADVIDSMSLSGGSGSGSGFPVQTRPPVVQPSSDYGDNGYEGSNSEQNQNQATRFPLNERNCGVMHETRIVGGEEADPDDFMWMAAIVKSRPKDGEPRPFCGGSLITRRHILTAAHCLEGLAPRDVLVRLGSYDFDDATAGSLSQDYAIDQFRVPAQYSKKTHVADIAIMRLKTPLSTSDNYKTVCMPQARRSYVGALGTVTGYGSQSQLFRRAAPKLRQVTVPIWENRKCSGVYKKNLTESFLCAGYEEGGKDACQGDSGGPLMTEGPEQKMMVVGVVSHGIGCGSPGYPGVYTRTTTFLDWIEKNTRE